MSRFLPRGHEGTKEKVRHGFPGFKRQILATKKHKKYNHEFTQIYTKGFWPQSTQRTLRQAQGRHRGTSPQAFEKCPTGQRRICPRYESFDDAPHFALNSWASRGRQDRCAQGKFHVMMKSGGWPWFCPKAIETIGGS